MEQDKKLYEIYFESIQNESLFKQTTFKSISKMIKDLNKEKSYRKFLIKRLHMVNSDKLPKIQKEKQASVLTKLINKSTDKINHMKIKQHEFFRASTFVR